MENKHHSATNSLDQIPQTDHDRKGVQRSHEEIHGSEEEESREQCPEGMCDGSGELACAEFDPDSGQYMRGVGTTKCLCRTKIQTDQSEE